MSNRPAPYDHLFEFDHMHTVKVLKTIHAAMQVGFAFALLFVAYLWFEDFPTALAVLAGIAIILVAAIVRILFELALVIFRCYEELRAIRLNTAPTNGDN